MSADQTLVIRPARPSDDAALVRLAQLEGAPAPAGRTLVAEVDGEVVAAFGLDGGERLGDPFQPTAQVLELLAVRAARLAPPPAPQSWMGRLLRRGATRPRTA